MKYLSTLPLYLCLHSIPLAAATLYTEGRLQVQQFGPPPALGSVTPCSNSSGVCSGTFQLLPAQMPATNGMTLIYGGNASSDYGVLRAAASGQTTTPMGSFPLPPIPPYNVFGTLELQQTAGFRDTWNITGGTAGTAGTLELLFELTGVWTQGTGATADIRFASSDGATRSLFATTGGLASNQLALVSVPFLFGQDVDFRVEMQARVYMSATGPGMAFPSGAFASVNAMNTGTLTGAVVRNSSGDMLPTWYLATQSGSPNFLNIGQSEVPEPGTLALAAGALLILAWRRGSLWVWRG